MNDELRIVNGEKAYMSGENYSPFQIHYSLFDPEVLGYGE